MFTRSGSCYSGVHIYSKYKCIDEDDFVDSVRYYTRNWARALDLVQKKKRMFVLLNFIAANLDILFRPKMAKLLAVLRAKMDSIEHRIPGVGDYRIFMDKYENSGKLVKRK